MAVEDESAGRMPPRPNKRSMENKISETVIALPVQVRY